MFTFVVFAGVIFGETHPLIFALLPNKQQETYDRLFHLLSSEVANRGLVFQPTHILLDFEVAAFNVIRHRFPNSLKIGCLFHFDQCIHRHVQQIGLQTEYQNNDNARRWIRRILALPLAPLNTLAQGANSEAWRCVLEIAPAHINNDLVQQLHTYCLNQWIDLVNAQFAPFLWNHWNTGNVRTINAVEGWHRIINSFLRKPHPHIYKFMEIMKQQQHKSAIRVAQLQNGAPGQRRKKHYARVDDTIQRLKQQLTNENITLGNYLDAVGYHVRF